MHKVCLYISPEPEPKKDFEKNQDDSSDSTLPWWMKSRNKNRVIYYKKPSAPTERKQDVVLDMKYLGTVKDPEVRVLSFYFIPFVCFNLLKLRLSLSNVFFFFGKLKDRILKIVILLFIFLPPYLYIIPFMF